MARTAAVARSPVVFFTEEGTQIEIPMSLIYFDDGVVGTTRPASSATLVDWLKYQASLGHIVAGLQPPTPPAFVVNALQAGLYGNKIEITTAPAAAPTKADSVDVTVSVTDRYPDVKVADLAGLLGTAATGGNPAVEGTKPGLLHVSDDPVGASEPTPRIVPELPADTWELAGAGANAVTLAPRISGTEFEAGDVLVRVDAGQAPGTFTLVVTWSATVGDVVAADFDTAFTPTFDFLVAIDKPDGAPFRLPRAGTRSLAGGSEQAAATNANATVLADD